MKFLSRPAQAVLDAAFAVEDEWDTIPMIAAALRAAADQVVPTEEAMPLNLAHRVRWDALQSARHQLLAIAAELESQ